MSPMNNRLLVPRKMPGLLDLVPGAAAAYSLRSLSNSYAGPVVTVRRSSDNAEDSFTAAEVADGTLAAFCGAGDGFVKQWWDQSGNANHAVAAADTNEPQIVDSGVVVTEEGKSAILFDGSDDTLDATFPSFAAFTAALVCTNNADNTEEDRQDALRGPSGFLMASFVTDNQYRFRSASTTVDYYTVDKVQHIHFATNDGATSSARVDGSMESTGSDTAPSGGAYQVGGNGPGGYSWSGTLQEVIVWPSDLTAQRELIEGNIAWGYSV